MATRIRRKARRRCPARPCAQTYVRSSSATGRGARGTERRPVVIEHGRAGGPGILPHPQGARLYGVMVANIVSRKDATRGAQGVSDPAGSD